MISAGKYNDAVKIYEDDLKNFPNNGWAFKGLVVAFEKLDDKKKSTEAKISFNNAWKYADIEITSSRILQN